MVTMAPEERFERIERQLEFSAGVLAQLRDSQQRQDAGIARNSRQISQNSRQIARNSRQIAQLAEAVSTLAHVSDEQGDRIDVSDPLAPTFASIASQAGGDPSRIADGFLDLAAVFGADLCANPAFRSAVRANVEHLFRHGARAAVAAHLGRG